MLASDARPERTPDRPHGPRHAGRRAAAPIAAAALRGEYRDVM